MEYIMLDKPPRIRKIIKIIKNLRLAMLKRRRRVFSAFSDTSRTVYFSSDTTVNPRFQKRVQEYDQDLHLKNS